MQAVRVALVLCAVGWVAAQDAYTQGVVNGATLALAGTAVVGLGALAIKQHQNRRRNRYRGYAPYYNGYYQQPYQQQGYNDYYQSGYQQPYTYYRRRRSAPVQDELEGDFEKIMAQDQEQCGMRVVCELEAQAAAGRQISHFGKLILSLFGTEPAPVPDSALDTAHGRYGYAAYIGANSSLDSCGRLYPSCRFSSEEVLRVAAQ